mmetsp:Transcript_4493/g.12979  ORF Transcript_4493/g.12979 Transcript_4493/m.12979 type:complete len:156 (-) Transcript_4493:5143-5610(-)
MLEGTNRRRTHHSQVRAQNRLLRARRQDGEPIVFFCGAGFGRRNVPTPFPGLLEEHSVRFIAVDRPGYGRSDPHPGRTYRDWAGDVQELMDHLELDRACFLAHSAGTPHLAAVCAFAPKRVTAASFVCPVAPITGTPPTDRRIEIRRRTTQGTPI